VRLRREPAPPAPPTEPGGHSRTSPVRRPRILVVDDEPNVRGGIRRVLSRHGYDVVEAATCHDAELLFASQPPDAVLLDERLPDGRGVDLLSRLHESSPGVPVLMLTGHASIDLAVRAVKAGAEQFLTKPVDTEALRVLLERLLAGQRRRRAERAARLRPTPPDPFFGADPAMVKLARDARRAAEADRPVLILGETGTGKSLLARWIHDAGPRRDEPYVDLNCAGLSAELLDSELFGHERGAFTGAASEKDGLFTIADRGSVFLDEIGDMEPGVQARLLKVLEERRFRRLGGVRDLHVDVRLIAATHQDLEALIEQGRFREDLVFRINTLQLRLPPLRARSGDIPILARRLLERCTAELGRPPARLSGEALEQLKAYAWPGNIRELRSVLERALLTAESDELTPEELRLGTAHEPPADADPGATLASVEERHIRRALAHHGGNVAHTARSLGISTSSLYQRIQRFGINR